MSVRLELVVLSYNGQALAAPLSRALDAPVSVGRGSDNDLPLNDPERLISRHQARLSMGPGGTVDISNLSSNSSLFINGNELAPGRSCTMSPSDQLLVGRYVLGLRAATLPAAAPIAPTTQPIAAPPPVSAAAPTSSASTPSAAASAASYTIPPPSNPPKPAAPRPVPVPAAAPMATRPKPVQMIPDDFDVFSPPKSSPPPYGGSLTPDLAPGDVSIEDFSEKAAVREVFSELQVIGNDVIAEPAEEARQRQRVLDLNRSPLDPMQLLDVGNTDSGASVSLDHGLEIDSLFVLPAALSEDGTPIAPPPVAPVARPAPPPIPQGASPAIAAPAASGSVAAAEQMMANLLGAGPPVDPTTAITSFDELLLGDATATTPAMSPVAPAPAPVAAPAPRAAPTPKPPVVAAPVAAPPPVTPPLPPARTAAPVAAAVASAPAAVPSPPPIAAATAAATSIDQDAAAILRAAFARGCGIDVNHISEFTPQAMEMLGRIVAAMTAGTIRLMHGRSSTKHEMRANVTIIATDGNNPLKFAPDGAAALTQLLGRGSPGFMPPLRAIDDAFDDLSAHQVGLLAGSRAAMYDVAAMLGPERFLARAGEKSGLETMMPAKHKARLWDLYESGYQEMVGEAREEFENLFQRAFARAYEQEIDRINTGKSR
jgi:FHA domain-containing protein